MSLEKKEKSAKMLSDVLDEVFNDEVSTTDILKKCTSAANILGLEDWEKNALEQI